MFKRIVFGYSDARTESALLPSLLREGFYENASVTSDVIQGSKFLVLGYKGSGKSAIAERLRLLAEQDFSLFVANYFLSDFPYDDFASIQSGFKDSGAGLAVAWNWVLLLKILESFSSDELAMSHGQEEMGKLLKFLKGRGFLPADDLNGLVLKSHKITLGAELPTLGRIDASREREQSVQDPSLASLVKILRNAVFGFSSESRHVLVIDGLDDILSGRSVQYDVLEALVRTAARLNMDLQESRVPARVLLLCRTDLYERLPGPNKSKIRQDHGVHLSWVDHSDSTKPSRLVGLANLRARLSTGGRVRDIFSRFFPAETHGVSTIAYLLAYTRHTPRDFLQLLTHIQRFARDTRVSDSEMRAGICDYASEYFLPQIKDELAGYSTPDHIQAVLAVLASTKKKEIAVEAVLAALRKHGNVEESFSLELLRTLFECSAVGTVHTSSLGEPLYTFRYRTRDAALLSSDRLITHPALWVALDLMRGLSMGTKLDVPAQ